VCGTLDKSQVPSVQYAVDLFKLVLRPASLFILECVFIPSVVFVRFERFVGDLRCVRFVHFVNFMPFVRVVRQSFRIDCALSEPLSSR
jgi:hypothetical protein